MACKWILITLIARTLFLWAEDEPMTIESGEAVYNGQDISLTGQVTIQHELGRMTAKELSIVPIVEGHPDPNAKKILLNIRDQVVIDWSQGGRLQCQEAKIDCAQLIGTFVGDSIHPEVIYESEQGARIAKSKSTAPIIIRSKKMEMAITRQYDAQSKTQKNIITRIQADEKVKVQYDEDYTILTDHAHYQQDPDDSSQRILRLYPDSSDRNCQLSHLNGDLIKSDSIVINLADRTLVLTHPRGKIQTCTEPQQPLCFSSDKLTWDEEKKILSLEDHVHIEQTGLGKIETDRCVQIKQEIVDGKVAVRSFIFPLGTELTYLDSKKAMQHKIICYGPLEVDHVQRRVRMESPLDEKGEVLQDKQIYFEDLMGDIYADQAEFSYLSTEQGLVPTTVVMQGHVKIFNRFHGHLQESGSVLQYALADRVDYYLKEQEMLLASKEKNRVLFFDKINNLRMSAPSLKILHDKQSNKESIQGIGDVRFTFVESEFEELKKRFKLKESL